MKTITFEDLGLDALSLEATVNKGYEIPTPIQALAIPRLLSGDSNLIAKARTGTGKTAAFALPIIQKLRASPNVGVSDARVPRTLVLAPTRELAMQDAAEIESLAQGRFSVCTIYGGQSISAQLRSLKRGVDIVVGTPGRVIDHLERKSLILDKIEFFILDEGDEMLDMGFIEDIEKIFSLSNPASRVMLFSATMPEPILKIASRFMGEYEIIEEEFLPEEPVLTKQTYWLVREQDKIEALSRLIDSHDDFYGLVFTQTKIDADAVCRELEDRGFDAEALHGDIAQNQREKILARFRRKKIKILVATDVAARGIDIEALTHVVNYALPFDSASYVHRIGRTGRAGLEGEAVSFVRPEERRRLEFLKAAAKKATKAKMEAGVPPTVEYVLSVKSERIVRELCETPDAALTRESDAIARIAWRITDSLGAEEALRRVLNRAFGDSLDPVRYNEILPVQEKPSKTRASGREAPRFGTRKSAIFYEQPPRARGTDRDWQQTGNRRAERFSSLAGMNQMRLYVSLGYRDGMGPREIAKFFSGLLNIPQRQVDRIEMTENFSLVSLPADAGRKALEKSQRDKKLPHMHIDNKGDSVD